MERYLGQPHFVITDHEVPDDFEGMPREEMANRRKLSIEKSRQIALEAIQQGRPIRYHASSAKGDNLITRWVYKTILERLCQQEQISPTQISLSDSWAGSVELNVGNNVSDVYEPSRHAYYAYLRKLGFALGVEVSPEHATALPQLTQYENLLDNTYRQSLIDRSEDFRRKCLDDSQRVVTISQSGSVDEKRFNDGQVTEIISAIRKVYPDFKVMVASDKNFRYEENFSHPYQDLEDGVVLVQKNGEDLVPLFYASDVVITTDSYYGHLAAGSIAMRSDRAGRLQDGDWLGLYTVVLPEYWGVVGGHIVESAAVKNYRPHGWNRLMGGIMDERRDYRDFMGVEGKGIHPIDIQLVIGNLPELASFKKVPVLA